MKNYRTTALSALQMNKILFEIRKKRILWEKAEKNIDL